MRGESYLVDVIDAESPSHATPAAEHSPLGAADRLQREREFHNSRFDGGDHRRAQFKYYVALDRCFARYSRRVEELARNADVLEYGCGEAAKAIRLAPIARRVEGIDISDTAIESGRAEAERRGLTNVGLSVQNAEAMTFADDSFDLVFGSGILHHLDLERALREIRRVLKPGGAAVFVEPLGHNPAIELYRKWTPDARTPDEHPLTRGDLKRFTAHFGVNDLSFYGLTSLLTIPLRNTAAFKIVKPLTARIDDALLRAPGIKWLAWYAFLEGQKTR